MSMSTPALAIKKGTILELHHSLKFDKNQIDEVEKEMTELPENIRVIEQQLSELNLFKVTQQREFDEVAADLETLNEELSVLEDSINNLETINADVSALKSRQEPIRHAIAVVNDKSNAIKLEIDSNEQKVSKLEKHVQLYTHRMTTNQALLEYLTNAADKLSVKMGELISSLSDEEINEVINDAELAPIFNEWQRKAVETADADYVPLSDSSAEANNELEATHVDAKLSNNPKTFFSRPKSSAKDHLSHHEHSTKKEVK